MSYVERPTMHRWAFAGAPAVHLTMNVKFLRTPDRLWAAALCGQFGYGETLAAYETASGDAANFELPSCITCRESGEQLVRFTTACLAGSR